MEIKFIEVVLVNVFFDLKGEMKNGEFPVKKLFEVEKENYPFFVKLGAWKNNGELVMQPYTKAKINGKYMNVDIAIKVYQEFAEQIEGVRTQSGDVYSKYIDDEGITYYLPPRKWKRNACNGKIEDTVVSHYIAPGTEVLELLFCDRIELMSLVSGKYDPEHENMYLRIVEDLVSINQRLAINLTSSMSSAIKWTDSLFEDSEKRINEFCNAYWKLYNHKQLELKPIETTVPYKKVKKMTARTIVDYGLFHKEKVRATVYTEQVDTFEHRVIKTYLNQLKELLNVRQRIEISVLENERLRLKAHICKSEDDLVKKVQEIDNEVMKRKKELISKLYKHHSVDEGKLQWCAIQIRANKRDDKDLFLKYRIANNKRPECVINSNGISNADYCHYRIYRNNCWEEWKEYRVDGAATTQYIDMKIPMDCLESVALLHSCVDSPTSNVKRGDIIQIVGEILDDFSGVNNKGFSKFTFQFRKIQEVSILKYDYRDKQLIKKHSININRLSEEEVKRITEEYIEHVINIEYDGNSEVKGFYTQLINEIKKIRKLDELIDEKRSIKNRWWELKEKIGQIEKTDLIINTADVKTSLKSTNIFIFNQYYQKMFRIINQNSKVFLGIELFANGMDKFRVADLPQLYENWCLIKMLLLFIDCYGFELLNIDGNDQDAGVKGLRKFVKEVIENGQILNGRKFELIKRLSDNKEMVVCIWYEREFALDKEKIKRNNLYSPKGKKHGKLLPDYVMSIQYRGIEKVFVFDAKYRDYSDNDFDTKDLLEVAFQKYMLELSSGINAWSEFGSNISKDVISGSFILHSNNHKSKKEENDFSTKRVKIKYNKSKYLGAFPDVLLKHKWEPLLLSKKLKIEVATEKLVEWTTWTQNTRNNENKLGIIEYTPNNDNLKYIIQMIMEKHFGLYQENCWLCGGENEIEKKHTSNGYVKYHICCKECDEFMVETHCGTSTCSSHNERMKLGKHYENYYASVNSQYYEWNVACPVCRNLAPNSQYVDKFQFYYGQNNRPIF